MARFLKNRRSLVGKAPGTITFIGRQKMDKPRLRLITYNETELDEHESTDVKGLLPHIKKDRISWINIDGLHDQEVILQIGEAFHLPPLILEDIANTDQRPRLIDNDENLIIFLKELQFKEEKISVSADQVALIVGENYVISFQEKVGHIFEPIRQRLRQNFGKMRKSKSDYLFYRIFDAIADQNMVAIGAVGELIEANEAKILSKNNKLLIENIYQHKVEISYLRKAILPSKEVSMQLRNSESPLITDFTQLYFDDLDNLLLHTLETVEVYYSMISDQLNIFNTNLNHRANDVIKILTIFTTIFIPLTFIVGVYGTNFDYLPELHFKYSYFAMWAVMIVIVVVMLFYFKRKKWL